MCVYGVQCLLKLTGSPAHRLTGSPAQQLTRSQAHRQESSMTYKYVHVYTHVNNRNGDSILRGKAHGAPLRGVELPLPAASMRGRDCNN